MNSPPSHTADAALIETTLPDRVAALELFLQQLVFVLDAQGAMNADALTRWIDLARDRMLSSDERRLVGGTNFALAPAPAKQTLTGTGAVLR